MTRLLLFGLCVAASGCSFVADADADLGAFSDHQAYVDERSALLAELDRVVGTAPASSVRACAVVAVGEKACGGPAGYRVYSTEASDASEVRRLAEEVAAVDRRAHEQFGLSSTCDVPVEPTVVLVEGQCRAGDGTLPSAD